MLNNTPDLFVRVAEIIETSVKDKKDRREAYEILVEAFDQNNYIGLQQAATGIDPILDDVLNDYFEYEDPDLDEDFDDDLEDEGFDDRE